MGWGAPPRSAAYEVVGIFGPTASGKSAVAESVADRLLTEVVSADSMQVYRGLPILTNQPRRPTRLVAIRSTAERMSVGEYARLARDAIDELVRRLGTAVVAGGTGLYFRAALADLEVPPGVDPQRRRELERTFDADPARAHARLAGLDPGAAEVVHPNDRRRVVRALELAEIGASLRPPISKLWSSSLRRPTLVVGLDVPAAELERRIRERTGSMAERGVLDEVRRALSAGVSPTAEQALGLRALAELPLEEALEQMTRRTIRYASYQRKWMRRIPGIVPVDADQPPGEVADAVLDLARAR